MRYFLEIAYRGTHYHGWQIQLNAHTVQAELNKALQVILKHPIDTIGSGRTDTGVHASQQLVHLDTEEELSPAKHLRALNAILPPDIVIKAIYKVSDTAHVRFDAVARSYEYRISQTKDPFLTGLNYYFTLPLDVELMNKAAKELLDFQDFACFSRVKTDVKHFRCDILDAYWEISGEMLIFHIRANRFLRGMVRAIVGTLLEVGLHKMTIEEFISIINSKDRTKAGRAVPPEGLFLTKIQYPYELE